MIHMDQAIALGRLALLFGRTNRATFHEDGVTPESDSDHVVMLGLIACVAAQYVPGLNTGRIAEFVLVHDLVEAYAGDTNSFAITPEARAAKQEREEAALRRLEDEFFGMPWVLETLHAYEAQEEPEARFVRYLDKAMPKINHCLNGCATIKGMGHTLDDLILAHRSQLHDLNEQYPELAGVLGRFMDDLMRESERHY